MEENTLKSPLRTSSIAGAIALAFASFLVHPFGAVKSPTSTNLVITGAVVDSYVAPVSWLLENDVRKARSHMNLSGWDRYSLQEKLDHLAELAAAVRSRQMPPPQYTLMHYDAKL